MLNAESGINCLFIEIKLWDKPFLSSIQDFVTGRTQDPQTVISPIPFKWMLVEYSATGLTRSIKNSTWQPIASMPPTVSVCIRCPTPNACNETKAVVQKDSARFASHLLVSFATQAPVSRKVPFCIDKKLLPYNAISDSIIERSAVQNYMFMRPSDYKSFVQAFVENGVEQNLGTNEFVDADEVDKLISQTYTLIPYNATTTANFTGAMWEELYWEDDERPDEKARRLQNILGNGNAWLQKTLEESSGADSRNDSLRSENSQSLAKAFEEVRSSTSGFYWSGDRVLIKPFPVYRVSLEAFRQKKPLCSGIIHITNSNTNYTVSANIPRTSPRDEPALVSTDRVGKIDAEIDRIGVAMAIVHCQCRWADKLRRMAFSKDIMVTLRDANDRAFDQRVVTTTDLSDEFTMIIPRTTGYSILFEAFEYHPVVLRNFSHLFSLGQEIFLEPLLFISKELNGFGATGGTVRLVNTSGAFSASGIQVQLRAGLNNCTGPLLANTTTTTNGTWSVTLPGGLYTALATKPDDDYTAPPFTAALVPGRDSFRDWAVTPKLLNGDVRIILRGTGLNLYNVYLRVSGPNGTQLAETQGNTTVSADGLMVYSHMDTIFGSVFIRKQLPGVYRIQVYELNAMQSKPDSEWNLSNSRSLVEIYRGETLWGQYFVPIKDGNMWTVAEINGLRIRAINDMSTVQE
ncbi:uncharacterized protein LOC129600568 isoform X2 [Paramacrobiotus metropolitanus]|nr:uncharacterized protein LOC129600568 isoform X2 [Paramacrobiotus metropolitanus]